MKGRVVVMLEKLFAKQIEERVQSEIKARIENEMASAMKDKELEFKNRELDFEKEVKKLEEEKEKYKTLLQELNVKEDFLCKSQRKLGDLEERESLVIQKEEELNNSLYLYDCGIYEVGELFYQYNDSNEYKQAIEDTNRKMENMIKEKLACVCHVEWTVEGSRAKGRKQTNESIKMALRLFNMETNNYISLITPRTNIVNLRKKIQKSGDLVNKFNSTQRITLVQEYIDLKLELATLVYEQVMKKQEEKEEARRQAEIIREQEKLEREIAKEREKLAKEVKQYQTEIDRLYATVDMETGEINSEVAERLEELESKIEEIKEKDVNLEQRVNNKAGWIYCITNDSMPNSVKIGVTRRLNPQDRIDELGSASVPFRFNTNCVVFSEDAFALENELHKAFHSKRVNRANFRKEFFYATTQEVEQYIKEYVDPTVEVIHDLHNEEFLLSL